jgi:hypothetical protein
MMQIADTRETRSIPELERRHRELTEQVAGLTFDLGGLAYERARYDHYRVDVLAQRAGTLHVAERELGEVEKVLLAARDGIAGTCAACGVVRSRGAVYCWSCGKPVTAALPTSGS